MKVGIREMTPRTPQIGLRSGHLQVPTDEASAKHDVEASIRVHHLRRQRQVPPNLRIQVLCHKAASDRGLVRELKTPREDVVLS